MMKMGGSLWAHKLTDLSFRTQRMPVHAVVTLPVLLNFPFRYTEVRNLKKKIQREYVSYNIWVRWRPQQAAFICRYPTKCSREFRWGKQIFHIHRHFHIQTMLLWLHTPCREAFASLSSFRSLIREYSFICHPSVHISSCWNKSLFLEKRIRIKLHYFFDTWVASRAESHIQIYNLTSSGEWESWCRRGSLQYVYQTVSAWFCKGLKSSEQEAKQQLLRVKKNKRMNWMTQKRLLFGAEWLRCFHVPKQWSAFLCKPAKCLLG